MKQAVESLARRLEDVRARALHGFAADALGEVEDLVNAADNDVPPPPPPPLRAGEGLARGW